MDGGNIEKNVSLNGNGGGIYIANGNIAMNNGSILSNIAKNGGGFYQTQTSDAKTSTTLSGTCSVSSNIAVSGNGGGIYVDGGSTFRIINGKVSYNKATGEPSESDLK